MTAEELAELGASEEPPAALVDVQTRGEALVERAGVIGPVNVGPAGMDCVGGCRHRRAVKHETLLQCERRWPAALQAASRFFVE